MMEAVGIPCFGIKRDDAVLSACIPGRTPSFQHSSGMRGGRFYKRRGWVDYVERVRGFVGAGASMSGAVRLEACFMGNARLASERGKPYVGTPDISNMLKSLEDALTAAGVWFDDAQVVELHAERRRHPDKKPGGCCHVLISRVTL